MPDVTKDDKVFEYLLIDLLKPYTECARKWWNDYENKSFTVATTIPIEDGPPGMFERCTRSPRQSAIYGIQAFPSVSVSYLNLPSIVGGAMVYVEELCKKGFIIDEFTLVSKRGLRSEVAYGLSLCYVPTDMLNGPKARWVYMRPNEILELASGVVTSSLVKRILPYAQDYTGDI
jgi:hypothetical protein